jgi:hypothetical protein
MMSKTRELYKYMGARRFLRWHLYWMSFGVLPRHFDVDGEHHDAIMAAAARGALGK